MDAATTYTTRQAELKNHAAGTFSERRRVTLLKLQKKQRQKHRSELRKLSAIALSCDSSDQGAASAGSSAAKPSGRSKSKQFASIMQLPEWLVEVPSTWGGHVSDHLASAALVSSSLPAVDDDDDDDDDGGGWLVAPRLEGKLCLVVAGGGRTTVRDRSGATLLSCSSPLPGGGAEGHVVVDSGTASSSTSVPDGSRGKQRPYCILDAIFNDTSSQLYLLDVAAWAGQEVADYPAAFRIHWLASKWADDIAMPMPGMDCMATEASTSSGSPSGWEVHLPQKQIKYISDRVGTHVHQSGLFIRLAQWNQVTEGSLREVYRTGIAGEADGLLAIHAGAARQKGTSPFFLRWRDDRCSKWELRVGNKFHVNVLARTDGVCCTLEGIPIAALSSWSAPSQQTLRVSVSASSTQGLFEAYSSETEAVAERLRSAASQVGGWDGLLLQVCDVKPANKRTVADSMSKVRYLAACQNGVHCAFDELVAAAALTASSESVPLALAEGLAISDQNGSSAASAPITVGHTPRQTQRKGHKPRQQLSMAKLAAALASGAI